MKGLIGKKVGMTQLISNTGAVMPVTLIEAGPCFVTQIRTVEKDGYSAVQLGFGEVNPRKLSGGEKGHLKRNGLNLPPLRHLHEFRVDNPEVKEGDKITVGVFTVGEHVDVTGISKGKGFQGGIKRHHFRRQPKTHGASDRTRAPGASSSNTTPGRLRKGKRMAGHMGRQRVTSQNIEVALVDVERNLLGVRGSVPGPTGAIVYIKPARKRGK
ncbi:MAG: 50S ribosomal protein L3 [Anaerolineales bacterium]|nr:50S ribosomal protein L3 [Anaerolineales bacterium]